MSGSDEVEHVVTPRFLGSEHAGCAAVRRGRRLATDPAIEAATGKTEFGRLQLHRAKFDIGEAASPPASDRPFAAFIEEAGQANFALCLEDTIPESRVKHMAPGKLMSGRPVPDVLGPR